MNYDEVKLRRLIGKCQWTFAKTMPTCVDSNLKVYHP